MCLLDDRPIWLEVIMLLSTERQEIELKNPLCSAQNLARK